MKKFAKILVVALTVCLIVGVMAVSASAVSATKPDGAQGAVTSDSPVNFQTQGNAHKDENSCCKVSTSSNAIYYDAVRAATHTHTGACKSGGMLLNKYGFLGSTAVDGEGVNTASTTVKYVTTDFDFWSDAYMKDDGTYTTTEEGNGILAYSKYVMISEYNAGKISYAALASFVQDKDGNWYLSEDAIYDSSDIKLATKKNEKNHVTILDTGDSTLVFVNGIYLRTYAGGFNDAKSSPKKVNNEVTAYNWYYMIGFSMRTSQTVANATQFSIKASQVTQTRYSADYDSSNDSNGITNYINNKEYDTKNLISCVDTYYNANYSSATFTYKDFDGNTIKTTDFEISKALTGFNKFFDLKNGWFNVNVTSWKLEGDSQGEIVAGGTYTLVPDDVEAVVALDYKANVTLLDKFQFNIYVKKIDESIVKNVTFTGGSQSSVNIDGADYYCLKSSNQSFFMPAKDNGFSTTVSFTAVYNEAEFPLEYTAQVTVRSYVNQGLVQYGHESSAGKLIVNFVNYMAECYEHAGNSIKGNHQWLFDLITEHKDCCLSSALPNAKDEKLSYSSQLTGYMVGYYPELTSNLVTRAGIAIYVPKGESVSMSAKLWGIAVDKEDGKTKTNQLIEVSFTKKGTYTDVEDNNKEYDVYLSDLGDLAIYNMLETVTITIGEKSGTYNLAEYVVANPTVEYTNALYRFAEAAKAYKEDGKTLVQ